MQSLKMPGVASPVRMRPLDKKYIQKIARESRMTQAEVLHRAVELLRRERQFQEIREAYSGLSKKELALIHKESLLMDKASSDGIE